MTAGGDERLPPGGESPGEGEGPPPHDRQGPPPPPERRQPTEEQFALEAGLSSETGESAERTPPEEEEPFEGIPPEDLPPPQPLPESGETPALEPQFAEALREAGEPPPDGSPAPPDEEPAPPPPDDDPGATVEYAPGEAPEEAVVEAPEEATVAAAGPAAGDKVRTVVIGAGSAPPVGPPPATAAADSQKPPPGGDSEPAPKPKPYWWRFALASFVIVAAVSAATSSSVLLYIDAFAKDLRDSSIRGVSRVLDKVPDGGPENILILGSDKRADTPGDPGRSDTTILLRIDPDRGAIALMSIPRDLKVNIPGIGVGKFNAAFTFGGPKLTVRMVKKLTGLRINHLVNVDFLGFVRAVDAIGCVWADVDRRYFHSNAGLPPSQQYSEINIKAGYQRLCGKDALAYVRYRHTDTDLVRAARQQDFLRESRQRVPLGTLIADRTKLLKIFTSYTSSDINEVGTALEVLKALFEARGATIEEVHFPAVLGPSYVYASRSAIRKAVNQFLGIEASGGPRGSLDRPKKKKRKVKLENPGDDGLVPAPDSGRLAAEAVSRKVSAGFRVFYPTRLPSGAIYVENSSYNHVQNPRAYHLRDTDGAIHGAYRMTIQLLPQGDYFGIQGLRGWENPPILGAPSETRTIGGREYDFYLDGDRVRLVAWRDRGSVYWVSNSLLQTLTNDQMLGIARSVKYVDPKPKHPRGKKRRR